MGRVVNFPGTAPPADPTLIAETKILGSNRKASTNIQKRTLLATKTLKSTEGSAAVNET